MIHKVAHFAAYVLNNPYTLAPMCMALVFVPILECGQSTNMGGNTGNHLTEDTSRVIINKNGLEYIRAHVSERTKNRKTNPRGREVGTLLKPRQCYSAGYH